MQALFLFFSKKIFFLNYIYNLLKRHAESLMCIPDKTETLSFIGISAYSGSQISKTSFREISNGSFTSISTYSDSQRADDPVEPSAL